MSKNINYITLNILRVANIISLILVAVTSWTMLVMTIKAGTFFFFDGVSHLVMSLICVFLITSEISLFNRYFAKHWPALGLKSGFNFLGLSMILLGSGILRNLKEEIVKRGEDDNQVVSWKPRHGLMASGIILRYSQLAPWIFQHYRHLCLL